MSLVSLSLQFACEHIHSCLGDNEALLG